jgi:hypothetical protein
MVWSLQLADVTDGIAVQAMVGDSSVLAGGSVGVPSTLAQRSLHGLFAWQSVY